MNPYNHQLHLFDKNQPENLEFLKKFRAVLEPSGAAAVGEVGDAQRGLEIMAEYTSGGDKVQMCYPFELLQPKRATAAGVAETFARLAQAAPDAWPCWAYSNHDTVRHTTRWGLSDAATRVYATMLMCLRGSACLYQGEELGLPEAELAFEDLQDPYGIEFWPEFKGRDGCRTPMVWEADNRMGGFTTAAKAWLPVPAAHLNRAVGRQAQVAGSMLAHYTRALALRRAHPVLRAGTTAGMRAEGDVVHFLREDGAETMFCAFNLGAKPATIAAPEGNWRGVGDDLGSAPMTRETITLDPWQCCLAVRA